MPIIVIRLKEGIEETAILNTRVEVNVIIYKLTKSLRCPILSTKYLKLRTVLGQVL